MKSLPVQDLPLNQVQGVVGVVQLPVETHDDLWLAGDHDLHGVLAALRDVRGEDLQKRWAQFLRFLLFNY